MWKELVSVFSGQEPLQEVADRFVAMLTTTHGMAETVRAHVHDHALSEAEWTALLAQDEQVNAHEWAIRRALVSHIAIQKTELPYCLKLMSLVKDAERLGEYVKNVAEVTRDPASAVSAGPVQAATEALVVGAMQLFAQASGVIVAEDRERAEALIGAGKQTLQDSDDLVRFVAHSELNAAQASSASLVAFFYRRIVAHLINLVSSVVLPVHELDRYDERFA